MWDLERIKSSNALIDHYGLKNMKELWKAQTEIGRIRRNARLLLSGGQGSENIKGTMFAMLERIGLAKPGGNRSTTCSTSRRTQCWRGGCRQSYSGRGWPRP